MEATLQQLAASEPPVEIGGPAAEVENERHTAELIAAARSGREGMRSQCAAGGIDDVRLAEPPRGDDSPTAAIAIIVAILMHWFLLAWACGACGLMIYGGWRIVLTIAVTGTRMLRRGFSIGRFVLWQWQAASRRSRAAFMLVTIILGGTAVNIT